MIELRALGSAGLRGGDGSELHGVLSQPGQLALLVYLTLARPRGLHRRDTLVALFWPDASQEQARNALRQATHRLRRALGPDVVVGRGAEDLGVDPDALTCDVVELERLLAAGDRLAALELYRGELLPGFFLPGAPAFEDWLEGERQRLRGLAASSAWEAAEEARRQGDASSAARWGRWAAARNPDDEGELRRLLTLLLKLGDNAGAMREYEAFAERLAREYEVEPAAETRALIASLPRARRSPAPGAVRANDPAAAERSAENQRLARLGEDQRPAGGGTLHGPSPVRPGTDTTPSPVRPRSVPGPSPLRPSRRRVAAIAAAVAVVAALGSFVGTSYFRRTAAPEAVAVFPFTVRGAASLDYLGDGMVDLLSTKLEGVPGFRSIDPHVVLASGAATSDRATPGEAARLAARLGAGSYVLGDVIEVGGRVQLSATMYSAESGAPIGTTSVDGEAAQLPELVDRLAGRLLAGRVRGRDPALTELAATTTRSLPALTAFLTGERALRAGRGEEARAAFLEAVRLDTTFALAEARLASTYGWSLSQGTIDPVAHLARAQRYADRLTPLARLLIDGYDAYYSGDPVRSEAVFRELTRAYPDRVEAWFMLAETLAHRAYLLGRSPFGARAAFERVLVLDPDNAHALVHLARIAAGEGKPAEAAALVDRFMARHRDSDRTLEMRALRAFALHDSAAVRALMPDVQRANAIELTSVVYAATMYAPDREGARVVREAFVASRAQRGTFELPFALLPATSFVRGRIVHGERSPDAMLATDAEWPTELRAMLVATTDLPAPRAAIAALRDSVERWTPHPARPVSLFTHHALPRQADVRAWLLALLAGRLGDSAAAATALHELEARAGASDTNLAAALARVVRAQLDARAGRTRAALAELEGYDLSTVQTTADRMTWVGAHARWLRAGLLASLGRDAEALELYRSFPEGIDAIYLSLAYPRIADLEVRLGRRAEARADYARFVELWRDCDPELRPLVEHAKLQLERI